MWPVVILILASIAFLVGLYLWLAGMPGKSFEGPLPPLTARQGALAEDLRRDVNTLAVTIGERNLQNAPLALARAAEHIEAALRTAGLPVERHSFEVGGESCDDLIAELAGSPEVVVIGAHYDTVRGCPGANDNGSGVAALLALARAFAGRRPARTLRFVAFANEEPPYFQTQYMGSLAYARRCRARGEDVVAMLSLETIGCYSDAEGSQHYPPLVGAAFPSRGNFIAFVGNVSSRALVREVVAAFRAHAQFPSEGAAMPGAIQGVGWSDHWSFWRVGYAAVMVTDTAPFRFRQYHTPQDVPEHIDFERMARVVEGLEQVVAKLADG